MGSISSSLLEPLIALGMQDVPTLGAIAALISGLIACDRVLFTTVDLRAWTGVMFEPTSARGVAGGMSGLQVEAMSRHPAIPTYLDRPDDLTPRRVSDISSDLTWLRGDGYQMLFRATAERYQLSMVTDLTVPFFGRGWVLTRTTSDFSQRDVDTASVALPMVAAATRRAMRAENGTDGGPHLTPSERMALVQMTRGATTAQAAVALGVSPRTVQKHLEHAYRKLDANNRVSALVQAHRLGVL